MTEDASVRAIKDTTANPAPLGLLGFGMTTVLLNLHSSIPASTPSSTSAA